MEIAVKFKQSIITTVKMRTSIRTYQPTIISSEKRKDLQNAIGAIGKDGYRFILIERKTSKSLSEKIKTYGVIKGANAFLIGIVCKEVENQKDAAVNFGYDFEHVILKATELGFGTCWIAGTFNAAAFARNMDLSQNEKITVISPVGIPAGKPHLLSKMFTRSAQSKIRKPWRELFFDGWKKSPLSRVNIGYYDLVLEMVRLAPSAVNSQPWRVIKTDRGFHFYAAATNYFALGKQAFLRYNDMGIALAHFELTCRELGLGGKWITDQHFDNIDPTLEYIQTWETEN